jgi:hypothetical protein
MARTEEEVAAQNGQPRNMSSLATAAARKLATTTKTVPQMQGISSRWLLKILPWVQVSGGTYRVNRRLTFTIGDGRLTFIQTGAQVQVVPQELREIALLRDFDDETVLAALAQRFVQQEFEPGAAIVESGTPADQIVLIAHGKVNLIGVGKYGDATVLKVLADGDHFSYQAIIESNDLWPYSAVAATRCTVLTMSQRAFEEVVALSPTLQAHVEGFREGPGRPQDEYGEAAIELASGHAQEDELPGTYVDYDPSPREYELSVAQTVLRVHTRVADLFNDPMNQTEQQLRLTIEALRERQEHEMVNNPEIGLLNNADFSQRIQSRTGAPTPDDFDELLATVWKEPNYFLAHPRMIAAFGRECNRRGLYPTPVLLNGHSIPAWRGIPLLPCNKIPVSDAGVSSVMLLRVGEESQGVVGLHQAGIPDEYQPSLSVRFMNIDEKAIINYLVSIYYSVAVLVPDALGILENVEIGLVE